MSRLPRLTGKQVIAALRRGDWQLSHIRGSHHYLRKGSTVVCVPVHSGEVLCPKTMLSILHQAGLSVEELLELIKE